MASAWNSNFSAFSSHLIVSHSLIKQILRNNEICMLKSLISGPKIIFWKFWLHFLASICMQNAWYMQAYWLISDLIPKKSEKFEFRKNFVTIFFSVKNWPKKRNFDFFCLRNFRKNAKFNSQFKSGIITWKMENFEKIYFSLKSA